MMVCGVLNFLHVNYAQHMDFDSTNCIHSLIIKSIGL